LHPFVTKSKKNLKTTSNEKLLRAASQKIDFFLYERENMNLKIELILQQKNRFYTAVSKQTKLFFKKSDFYYGKQTQNRL